MVRAAVSASQASLERPGSAPAPFSACPQAEPRPEAQHRTRHACRARVRGCERGGGWARAGGRAHASDSAKRACVSGRWAQGVHWARALACRASLFTARPCTQGVRRRALAWGISREEVHSRRGRCGPFHLLPVAWSAPRRLSALTLFGSLPWRRLPNNSAAERHMSGQCTIGGKHQVCLVCCDSFAQHAIAPRHLM